MSDFSCAKLTCKAEHLVSKGQISFRLVLFYRQYFTLLDRCYQYSTHFFLDIKEKISVKHCAM